MMTGYRSGSSIHGIIITDDQSIHRNIHLPALNLMRPTCNHFIQTVLIAPFPFNCKESFLIQIIHLLSERPDSFFTVNQRECMEIYTAFLYLLRIIQA